MNYATAFLGFLGLTTAIALPASSDDSGRTLPPNWSFGISALSGPGCPDQGKESSAVRTTRLTFGKNTVDASEIYYWFIAYPWMRVDLAQGHDHTWCQVTIAYKEFADTNKKVEGGDYKLRLHKNGTRGIVTYGLEEGVKSYWDFAYQVSDGKELTDTIEIDGPTASGQYAQELSSNNTGITKPIPLSKCGSGEFTFRTELWAFGKKGQKGIVASEYSTTEQDGTQYYGAQQGFNHDWEKCE
ncbi:hypothetical protein EJ02DRAFT_416116 [Clathrospora elynae]|uniref:Uncharacterized protein n=1 Tax=Clathrospora elynae TaxID=706981 RepID=A0A6A5S3N0_9PLEO|nr:hypothetical protein EJ02DRAFT_416116 [Clathrospora elynae]